MRVEHHDERDRVRELERQVEANTDKHIIINFPRGGLGLSVPIGLWRGKGEISFAFGL